MSEPGGFDYLDSVSRDAGSRPRTSSQLKTVQKGLDNAPVEGGEGYIGGNSNASPVGMDFVTGKKGSVTDRSVWDDETPQVVLDKVEGSGAPEMSRPGMDPTGEMEQKQIKMADGLPRTWEGNRGAASADSSESSPENEPTSNFGSTQRDPGGFAYLSEDHDPVNTSQEAINPAGHADESSGEHEVDFPQTENTSAFGDGAPVFKHESASTRGE